MASNVPRVHIRPRKYTETPCMDCPDRVVGCHGSCEKYKKFKDEGLKDWKKRKRAYEKEYDVESYEVKSKMRTIKRTRKSGS